MHGIIHHGDTESTENTPTMYLRPIIYTHFLRVLRVSVVNSLLAVTTIAIGFSTLTARAVQIDMPPLDKPLAYGMDQPPVPNISTINGTSPRTVQLLADALSRPQTSVDRRVQLTADLGETELPSALPPLVAALNDPDPLVVAQAAKSIGRIGGAGAADSLRPLLNRGDSDVLYEVVLTGGKLKDAAIVTAGLQSPNPQVLMAAMSVAFSGEHASAIAKRLGDPALPASMQAAAIDALGRIGDSKFGSTVGPFLSADHPVLVRAAAARALGAIKAAGQGEQLENSLRDPHPTVRRYATLSLPDVLPNMQASADAIGLLGDSDLTVQTAAADILTRVPATAAIGKLIGDLSSPYAPLHNAARSALVSAGKNSTSASAAADAAVALLADTNPRRREDASYVLGQIPSHNGYESHVQLLTDTDWGVAAQAAQSLANIGDPDAGAAEFVLAKRALSGKSYDPIQTVAAERAMVACGRLGYQQAAPYAVELVEHMSDFPANARAGGAWAFGVLGLGDTQRELGVMQGFNGAMGNILESATVKLEMVKAIANRGHRESLEQLRSIEKGMLAADSHFLVAAHWGICRINGAATPVDIPAMPEKADVSITDRSQQ
jgi:HEAT repeat protein